MGTQSQATFRIFMSHSSKDDHFCLRLKGDLQQVLGDESAVWYDAAGGLLGGDTWWRKIMQEVKTRNVFIIVLSPNAVASSWVNSEIDLAWQQKHSPTGKLIIPILYQRCEVRDDLSTLQIISFLSPKTYEAAFNELLLALGLSTSTNRRKAMSQPPIAAPPQKTQQQLRDQIEDLLYSQSRYEEALAVCDQALQLYPNDSQVYYNKGQALLNLKRYEEALMVYDQAIHIIPDDGYLYFGKGLILGALDRPKEAVAAYDQAIGLGFDGDLAYFSKGDALETLGRQKEAQQAYEKARQLGRGG